MPAAVVKARENVVDVDVKNPAKENLGKIEEIMIDKLSGRVAYLVLSAGGFLGIGEKYFPLPWNSIKYDTNEDCFILNMDKERFKNAPGFDKNSWPDMADRQWGEKVSQYYGTRPYWE